VKLRTYRCVDCPPDACEHPAGTRGRLPTRCPAHRRARDLKRERRKRSPLRVVEPDEVAAPGPAEVEASAGELDGQAVAAGSIREALRGDLAAVFSRHPAARTLERVADVLAQVLDSPAVQVVDPRIMPPLSRELRSIVQELVTATEAEEDDLFGGAGPVVVGG